jgi:hypothetical protein
VKLLEAVALWSDGSTYADDRTVVFIKRLE